MPFEFPEEYRDRETFSIDDIMDCARKAFLFSTKLKLNIGSADSDATNQYSYTMDAVKRYIDRQLKNEPYQQDSESRNSKKWFLRDVVERFFESYWIQNHFLNVSIKWNKDLLKKHEENFQKCDKQDAGSLDELLMNKTNTESRLKKLENQLRKLSGSPEDREAYVKDCVAEFERDGLSANDDKEYKSILWIQKMKEKILSQYLFDSLIELNEDLLREDINLLLNVEDDLHATDREIRAALRFKDLHNYYVGRIDLVDFLKKLCEDTKQSQEPESSISKEYR